MTPKSPVNEQHVMELVDVSLGAMQDYMDEAPAGVYTGAELFSAVLSLTARVIHVLLDLGADEAEVRKAVELLFPQPTRKTFDPRMN